ncbi:MAG TPA: hypothetical protein VEP89_08440 [Draconibacterium sp.]|nr:hypothetical protein [Draconibacterium sp.]
MKSTALLLLVFLFSGVVVSELLAQEAPAMPQNFFVIEEFVSPSDNAEFVKVQQKAVDLWNEVGLDIPLYTYATNINSYYWVVPIENFAGIDQLFEKVGTMTAEMKEKGYDADKEFKDLSTARQMVIHYSEELSYHPNGQTGQTRDNAYCELTFLYLKQGHEEEATKATQRYKDFYNSIEEKENVDWDVYTVWMGPDTPCWILMYRAESELAMRQTEAKLEAKYQDKFEELWTNFAQHVRKVDTQEARFLPNWSLNFE